MKWLTAGPDTPPPPPIIDDDPHPDGVPEPIYY